VSERIFLAKMSLGQIRRLLDEGGRVDDEILCQLRQDPRQGARRLWRLFLRKKEDRARARDRLRQMTSLERQLRRDGAGIIVGVDEAGRGPLAGPVVAAGVILPWPCQWLGLDDSKRMTPAQRHRYASVILAQATAVGVGIISAERIDVVGILAATWEAMRQAIANLEVRPDHILVDGPLAIPEVDISQTPVIKGDARSLSMAAASVVAKVTRDQIMMEMDHKYPQYGFAQHKGYGTPEHIAALLAFGPSEIHRRTFTEGMISWS
jgi:ribonuclease HII